MSRVLSRGLRSAAGTGFHFALVHPRSRASPDAERRRPAEWRNHGFGTVQVSLDPATPIDSRAGQTRTARPGFCGDGYWPLSGVAGHGALVRSRVIPAISVAPEFLARLRT